MFDTSAYEEYSERIDSGQTSVGQFVPFEDIDRDKKCSVANDLLDLLGGWRPDIVCSTAFTNTYNVAIRLLQIVKAHTSIPTIVGGIHASLVPEQVIAEDCVDMVCVGEGEGVISDLCDGVHRSEIKNIWYKESGVVVKNEMRPLIELDSLPYQDFDDYEEGNFYRPLAGKLYKSVSVDISRGCPHRCSYCVNHTFQKMNKGLGKYHRVKSVGNALGNIVHLKKKYKPELIRFWDEDFTILPIEYLREFAKDYKRYVDLPFLVYARVDTMSEEKARLLKSMGCVTIAMGIESGNPLVRKSVLNRHMTNEVIRRGFEIVRKAGIRCSAYNIIGLPHEGRKEIFDTIRLNKECRADSSSVVFLEPYQNTAIYRDCVKAGYIKEGYTPTFDFFTPHIKEILISHEELRGILKTFILYVKAPRLLWGIIRLCERHNDWLYRLLSKIFKGS